MRSTISGYLQKTPPWLPPGEVVGIVAPHAGYIYSGQVAACAYKCLEEATYDAVLVIAPSHRARFDGVSVYGPGGYETPLGVLEVDEGLVAGILAAGAKFKLLPEAHHSEHAIEIQLPFLQVLFGNIKIVPLLMGDQNAETCETLAGAIVEASGKRRILMVASADLSHFHDYPTARRMDERILKRLQAQDEKGLKGDLEAGLSESCGGGPMITVMTAARMLRATGARMLCYANSGDVTGDRGSVVGYGAAVYYRQNS